jgi:hypothetical protein
MAEEYHVSAIIDKPSEVVHFYYLSCSTRETVQ